MLRVSPVHNIKMGKFHLKFAITALKTGHWTPFISSEPKSKK